MSDWVFHTHEAQVRSAFTFTDPNSTVRPVSNASQFATALEQQNADFGRIRGIANAAKHLELTDIRPVPNAPNHAANTAIQTDFVGTDAYGRFAGGYDGLLLRDWLFPSWLRRAGLLRDWLLQAWRFESRLYEEGSCQVDSFEVGVYDAQLFG